MPFKIRHIYRLAPKRQVIIAGRYFGVASRFLSPSMFASAMKSKFTVCVEGNIACGKSKLLDYFKRFSSIVEVLQEPTSKWRDVQGHNVLGKMYEDPSRWGALFQSYSQLTMADLHTKSHTCPVKLLERSLYSGRYCFIENLHNSKVMPDIDYAVLDEWFNWLTTSQDIHVDLIVYLRTKPEVLLERIRNRLRPEEQSIPLKYLQDIHNLHEEWLIKKSTFQPPAPVLVLDANSSISEMYKLYEEEKSRILCGLVPNSH